MSWANETGSFALGDFAVEKGGVIREARLAWQRFGTLNDKRDNLILYPRADSTWYRSTCIARMTEIVGALVRHKRFYELTDQSPEFFHCSFGAFAQGSFEF